MILKRKENKRMEKVIESKRCSICREDQTVLVRLDENKRKSQKTTKVCVNPKCHMFIDVDQVTGWEVRS